MSTAVSDDGSASKATQGAAAVAERRVAMRWARHPKRVFRIEVETCQACGGATKVIARMGERVG